MKSPKSSTPKLTIDNIASYSTISDGKDIKELTKKPCGYLLLNLIMLKNSLWTSTPNTQINPVPFHYDPIHSFLLTHYNPDQNNPCKKKLNTIKQTKRILKVGRLVLKSPVRSRFYTLVGSDRGPNRSYNIQYFTEPQTGPLRTGSERSICSPQPASTGPTTYIPTIFVTTIHTEKKISPPASRGS